MLPGLTGAGTSWCLTCLRCHDLRADHHRVRFSLTFRSLGSGTFLASPGCPVSRRMWCMTKGKFGRFFLPSGRVSSAACLMPMKRVVRVWKQCGESPYLSATLWKYLNGSCFDFRAMDPFVDSSDCIVSSLQYMSLTSPASTRPHTWQAHSNCIHTVSPPHSVHVMPAPSGIAKIKVGSNTWRCAQCLLLPERINISVDQVGYCTQSRYAKVPPRPRYVKQRDRWHTYLVCRKQLVMPSQIHAKLAAWDLYWVPQCPTDDHVPIGELSTTELKRFRLAVNRIVPAGVYNYSSNI